MTGKRILKGVQVQFDEPDLDRIEDYRRSQRIVPTRAATIRGLVLLGLKAAANSFIQREEEAYISLTPTSADYPCRERYPILALPV